MAQHNVAEDSADHAHPPYLQHHFDTPVQQFDSGKLGMWLFLATEILLFGGLFVAYAVYRANHPEIFIWAHTFLDTNLGAINTVILLCSSLTMAWAVRATQLNQIKLMALLLCLTLLGGFGFMSVKYVEYKSKWEHGLLWARQYSPHLEGHGDHGAGHEEAGAHNSAAGGAAAGHAAEAGADHGEGDPAEADHAEAVTGSAPAAEGFAPEHTTLARPAAPPSGLAAPGAATAHHDADAPANAQTFFSIYFLMTGLHGLHVLVGMICIAWVLIKGLRGRFSSEYFTPVDLVGLYWHLVDLIWIFLFPLLYLIH